MESEGDVAIVVVSSGFVIVVVRAVAEGEFERHVAEHGAVAELGGGAAFAGAVGFFAALGEAEHEAAAQGVARDADHAGGAVDVAGAVAAIFLGAGDVIEVRRYAVVLGVVAQVELAEGEAG